MLVAYITLDGNTEDAFNFYAQALEGEIVNIQRAADMPGGPPMPEDQKMKIMHIALEAPQGMRLMGSDHFDFTGEGFKPGNNFSLSIHPDSEELADKYFNALSGGGSVTMPMSKAPWGDYFGMFTDKFGVKWMINCAAKR